MAAPSCCIGRQALEASSSSASSAHLPLAKNSNFRFSRWTKGFPVPNHCSSRLRAATIRRQFGIKAVATPESVIGLPLTAENVESVLDEVRPYLMSDGGNVTLHEIDGNIVRLKLQGACGSCPSSMMTMKMGIERRLMEKIPEIFAVEQVADEETGLELNEENIEKFSIRLMKIESSETNLWLHILSLFYMMKFLLWFQMI
ncbi:unnamed protein product [Victoria cruziana]